MLPNRPPNPSHYDQQVPANLFKPFRAFKTKTSVFGVPLRYRINTVLFGHVRPLVLSTSPQTGVEMGPNQRNTQCVIVHRFFSSSTSAFVPGRTSVAFQDLFRASICFWGWLLKSESSSHPSTSSHCRPQLCVAAARSPQTVLRTSCNKTLTCFSQLILHLL